MTKLFWKEVRKGDHLRIVEDKVMHPKQSLVIAIYSLFNPNSEVFSQDIVFRARDYFHGKVILVMSEPRPNTFGSVEMLVFLEGHPTKIASLGADYADWIRCA